MNLDGIIISIKEITKNKRYDCDCYEKNICKSIASLSLKPSRKLCICTEIVANARNSSDKDWRISAREWQLIDSDGYAYSATNLCEILVGYRHSSIRDSYLDSLVSAKTQVDFALTFPELEKDKEVVALKYSSSDRSEVLVVTDGYAEILKSFEYQSIGDDKPIDLSININGDHEYRYIIRLIDELELKINSRLTNVLTPSEVIKLENAIREYIFRINSEIKHIPQNVSAHFVENVSQIEEGYAKRLLELEEKDSDSSNSSVELNRRISQDVKDKVWRRDEGRCVECGSYEKLEFDHIIPVSKGGANTYRNVQLLCEPCNRNKSAKI